MAIIDAALVLVDGKGGTNVLDMGKPTTGGHNNLSGWLNVHTTAASGSIKLQESDDNASYTDVTGATYTVAKAGSFSVPFPKTTKRYVKAVLTTLTASDTAAFVGGLAYEKELA